MHGLWGMRQMMFTKYIVVVDDECLRTATNGHNTSEVLFRLCANTDPQRACPPKPWRRRHSFFTKGPSDVLDHATSEIASGSKSLDWRAFTPGHPDRRRTRENLRGIDYGLPGSAADAASFSTRT